MCVISLEIHRYAKVRRAIVDAGCIIPENMVIGYDHKQDKANGFRVTQKGVVLVTQEMLGQVSHRGRIPKQE